MASVGTALEFGVGHCFLSCEPPPEELPHPETTQNATTQRADPADFIESPDNEGRISPPLSEKDHFCQPQKGGYQNGSQVASEWYCNNAASKGN
jgi:hypothetical protein